MSIHQTGKRRDFLKKLSVGAGALSIPALGLGTASGERPPNILFIMPDDHAAHAIGAYGGRLAGLNPTPTIDRLAAEGMRFTRAFATNSLCMPSRATILSGQYSHKNDIRIISHFDKKKKQPLMQPAIRPENQRLGRGMQRAGYETAVVGKWHLVAKPVGFDYYCVLPGQGKYMNPDLKEKGAGPWEIDQLGGRPFEGHSSDVIANQALKWLKERKGAEAKPFFLMLHFKAPHDMFQNAPRYDSLYEDVEIPEPESLWKRGNHGPLGKPQYSSSVGPRAKRSLVGGLNIRKKYPDADDKELKRQAYQTYLKRYLRCVKGVDDNVARVLDHLKKTDQLDNTIIVYTSDQGMNLGEHDYQDKRWIYEESIRVPLIVRYPGRVEPGSTCDAMVTNVDFAPSLLELAGAKAPAEMQGRSIAPLLAGRRPEDWPREMYYRYWMHMAHSHYVPAHFGIRTDRYKLVFFYGLPLGLTHAPWDKRPTEPYWEMYDLEKDPHEMNNVYKTPEYAATLQRLKRQLKRLRSKVGDTDEAYPEVLEVIAKHWDA